MKAARLQGRDLFFLLITQTTTLSFLRVHLGVNGQALRVTLDVFSGRMSQYSTVVVIPFFFFFFCLEH